MQRWISKKFVLAKNEAGKPLIRKEEIFFWTKILNLTKQEALNILAIVNNKNKNLIID